MFRHFARILKWPKKAEDLKKNMYEATKIIFLTPVEQHIQAKLKLAEIFEPHYSCFNDKIS